MLSGLCRRMGRREMMFLFGMLLASLLGEAGAVTCFTGNTTYPACNDTSCNGGCPPDNLCACATNISRRCVPTQAGECDRVPSDDSGCCPPGLFYHPNSSCCTDQLNCDPACSTDEDCTDVSGAAKCQCKKAMFLHANRSEIIPTATCRTSVAHIEFSKCLLERFHYDYNNMHLLDDSIDCTGTGFLDVVNGERVLVIEPLMKAGVCGTIASITADKVTYSNVIYIPSDNSSGIIYSRPLNLSFSCTYNLTMQTSLSAALHPVMTTVTLPIGNGTGSVNATMAAYTENTYTTAYTAGYPLSVGDPIYIGIFTEFEDSAKFALRAERCYASPTSNGLNSVVLIESGCAVDQGTNTKVVSNGEAMEVRFSLDTFIFQYQPEVYMFCEVRLCEKTAGSTCTGCSGARAEYPTVQMSVGPIDMQVTFGSGAHTAVSWSVLGSSLLALLSLIMM